MSSPKLEAGINLGKSILGAVFNNKTGNEGKFQEAQAIKEKNKVALNPVMGFNNSASSSNIENNLRGFERNSMDSMDSMNSMDDVANAAKIGTKLGPWGSQPTTNNNAPAFIKGGYLKLFKK